MVGLPAAAGRNRMQISIDSRLTHWSTVRAARGEFPVEFIAWPVQFGEVEIGTTSEVKTLTVRNTSVNPMTIPATAGLSPYWGAPDQFETTDDGCAGQTLAQGDQCEVDLRFAPTATGAETAQYARAPTAPPFAVQPIATMGGVGIQP